MGIDRGLMAQRPTSKPLSTQSIQSPNTHTTLERETGIEPVSLAWKAKVLPLNYSRETWLLKTAPEDAFCRRLSPKTLNWVSLVEEGGFEPP